MKQLPQEENQPKMAQAPPHPSHTTPPRIRPDSASGVVGRALLVAFLLLLALLPVAFIVSIVWNDEGLTNGVPGPAQVSLLFFLAALMGLPALRRFGLTRRELLTVYTLLSVAAPVMSNGIIYYALPKVITFFYLARSRPEFEAGLLPYVPTWFSHLLPGGDGPLQEQQPLLTSRLGTQHHGSHDQGNGGAEDLHVGTLHKRRQRPKAPSKRSQMVE